MIDYAQLRGEGGEPELPEDGPSVATLDRAAVVSTQNGERLVTEWRNLFRSNIQWQSWNRFDATGMAYTRDLLKGLGVNLATVTDDSALERELSVAVGGNYKVRTTSQMGSKGDRVFVSTYADGLATGNELQSSIFDELQPDTSGLPTPGAQAAPITAPAAAAAWEDPNPPF